MGAWPTPSKYTFASKESTDTPWAAWYELPKLDSAFREDKSKSNPKIGPIAFFLNAIALELSFNSNEDMLLRENIKLLFVLSSS